MLARCIDPNCRAEIKDGWSFCTRCGTDNRHPNLRFAVPDCDHQIEDGEFCVRCGTSIIDAGEEHDGKAIWREMFGWVLLAGGVGGVIVSQIMRDDDATYRQAYWLARAAFVMIPAGAVLIVFFGRRWKIFKNR